MWRLAGCCAPRRASQHGERLKLGGRYNMLNTIHEYFRNSSLLTGTILNSVPAKFVLFKLLFVNNYLFKGLLVSNPLPASWAPPGALLLLRAWARRCMSGAVSPLGSSAPARRADPIPVLTLYLPPDRTRASTAPGGSLNARQSLWLLPPRGPLPHLPPKGLFRSTHILEKAYPTSWNSSSLFSAAPCLLF